MVLKLHELSHALAGVNTGGNAAQDYVLLKDKKYDVRRTNNNTSSNPRARQPNKNIKKEVKMTRMEVSNFPDKKKKDFLEFLQSQRRPNVVEWACVELRKENKQSFSYELCAEWMLSILNNDASKLSKNDTLENLLKFKKSLKMNSQTKVSDAFEVRLLANINEQIRVLVFDHLDAYIKSNQK
jgi:uncharacterized protein YaaR (DUF327 family)